MDLLAETCYFMTIYFDYFECLIIFDFSPSKTIEYFEFLRILVFFVEKENLYFCREMIKHF
jgi:hypothetical protein